VLGDRVEVSEPYQITNSRGVITGFGIELALSELTLRRTLKAGDLHSLECSINEVLELWERKYLKHQDTIHKLKQSGDVDRWNLQAAQLIESLMNLLNSGLSKVVTFTWEDMKKLSAFYVKPKNFKNCTEWVSFINFDQFGKPISYQPLPLLEEISFQAFKAGLTSLRCLFKRRQVELSYQKARLAWENEVASIKQENERRNKICFDLIGTYNIMKKEFECAQDQYNNKIDRLREESIEGSIRATEEYFSAALGSSDYSDSFPHEWQLEYRPETKMLVIEYALPAPNDLPRVESYRYIKARDTIETKYLSDAKKKNLYNSVIYQICLRTIYELFSSDIDCILESVVFNGYVTSPNPATGHDETKIITSISTVRDSFSHLNLAHVDPKATFKLLKGVSAANLVNLVPIPPIVRFDRSDKRFIDGQEVIEGIDQTTNLAAMDWGDFEHLIRQLFEMEFSQNGGEVKVTQASSDGGVDAIAFDPDPIRGGKIVIQAKRYTNTVGVAAVRDLYGTVLNEGASKGILVTTSDYGRDSYEFSKDKPLTLLNGSNLLALLEKHGQKAKIDIAEAKRLMSET
jgi:restriction system protein